MGVFEFAVDFALHEGASVVGFDVAVPLFVGGLVGHVEGLFSEEADGGVVGVGEEKFDFSGLEEFSVNLGLPLRLSMICEPNPHSL